MKKRGFLPIVLMAAFLLALSVSAGAVEGIIVGPDGLPLDGFSNVYVIDGKAQPVYNFAENRWYDVFVIGTDENGTPICHVVPSSRTSNELGLDKGNIQEEPKCFTGDTLVMMADGSIRMIKDIAAGDRVMGYDFATGRFTPSEVISNKSAVTADYYILNGGLKVTERHPFFAKNLGITPASIGPAPVTTIEARDLRPYATLYGFSTTTGPVIKKITLRSIGHVDESATVYNLQVEGTGNFFVSPDGTFFIASTSKPL
jgi:hypothetical protein